jgi:hypothetical protein
MQTSLKGQHIDKGILAMNSDHLERLESLGHLSAYTHDRVEITFDNDYRVSILYGGFGHSRENLYRENLYELAVINPDNRLDYSTPVTDDVLSFVTINEVVEAIELLLETYPAGEQQ